MAGLARPSTSLLGNRNTNALVKSALKPVKGRTACYNFAGAAYGLQVRADNGDHAA
jgi:hypothetical protein